MWIRLLVLVLLWCGVWISCSPSPSGEEATYDAANEVFRIPEEAGFAMELVSLDLLPERSRKAGFVLRSSAFQSNKKIPAKYGCLKDGNFQKPSIPLEWSGAPSGTRSFVLLMDDITPLGREWIHWAVYNIPGSSQGLEEGASTKSMPEGSTELNNTWQLNGYGGPCPPTFVHVYRIRLFAFAEPSLKLISTSQSSGIVKQLPTPLGVAELRGSYP